VRPRRRLYGRPVTEDELETLREALVALRRAEALELPSYLRAALAAAAAGCELALGPRRLRGAETAAQTAAIRSRTAGSAG
jgi:hypothetical protein